MCMLPHAQDDELPPPDGTWLQQLDAVFSSQPSIGIVGMNTYRLCRPKEWGNKHGRPAWLPDDRTGGAHWTYAQVGTAWHARPCLLYRAMQQPGYCYCW